MPRGCGKWSHARHVAACRRRWSTEQHRSGERAIDAVLEHGRGCPTVGSEVNCRLMNVVTLLQRWFCVCVRAVQLAINWEECCGPTRGTTSILFHLESISMKLRLGLVGLSREWTNRHLPALRLLQDRFEVRGVYTSIPSRAEAVVREFHAQRFEGLHALIKDPRIDAVLVLEESWWGTLPIRVACAYGKAVYCGADVHIEPDVAALLRAEIGQSGIAFMAEFPRRYAPATLRLKELIATRLGAPTMLFCHRRLAVDPAAIGNGPSSGHHRAEAITRRLDREIMELIDWCCFVSGTRPRSIQAVEHPIMERQATSPQPLPPTDYFALSLDLSAEGAPHCSTIAQISCGSYIPSQWEEAIAYRPPAALQVRCEKGIVFLDLPSSLVWFDEAGRHQESLESELSIGQQLLTMFHRSITSLVRKTSDLDDVFYALLAMQTARQSIAEGRRLALALDAMPNKHATYE
ncbi:MAG: hypothetical protein KatS3mg111_0930 [Pirellulaceae bacterium]|nr:MAG: hypothetical protein KatS3mg111_0930 [Pirellulaceae bacterium]